MSGSSSSLARFATAGLLALATMAAMAGVDIGYGVVRSTAAACFTLAGVLAVLALVITPPPFWPPSWRLPGRGLLIAVMAFSAAGLAWHVVNYAAWLDVHDRALSEGLKQDVGNIHIEVEGGPPHGLSESFEIRATHFAADAPARLATATETTAIHDNIMTNDWPVATIEASRYEDPDMATSAFDMNGAVLDTRPLHPPVDAYVNHAADAAMAVTKSGKLVLRGDHFVLTIPLCLGEAHGYALKGLPASDIVLTAWSRPDDHTCANGDMATFAGETTKGVAAADLMKRLRAERQVTLEQYAGDGKRLVTATLPLDRLAEAQAAFDKMRNQVRKDDVGPRYSLFHVFVDKAFLKDAVKSWLPDPHGG